MKMDITTENLEYLKNQLAIARNEVNNLRQQVKNLTHLQRKDNETIKQVLKEYRCEGCREKDVCKGSMNHNVAVDSAQHNDGKVASLTELRTIGTIRTSFPEKRAVPRQTTLSSRLKGRIELNSQIFTNPEHSLEGLEEFSHLWIIYHFHKNLAHPKAKVAPPRLGGERVGVFSTRSPHRPCPIGLSLVEIERIENSTIHFIGTDMIDETPVLDIKPYIPFYDSPSPSGRGCLPGAESTDFYNLRQEPDGEESELESKAVAASSTNCNNQSRGNATNTAGTVKIPNWIMTNHPLMVLFNENAETQIRDLQVDRLSIVDVLQTDPRSVYLRTKHASQIFTFQLSEVTVTCKFDDRANTVTVVQVRKIENVQDDCN